MRHAVIALLIATAAGAQASDMRTRAELSGFEQTSTHVDVMRLVTALATAAPLARHESYGRTEEGREMPLLVLSDPAVVSPDAARALGRPIVLVQANIHAGEVEGKEAALILARRLTQGDLRPLLRQLTVLMAPVHNADGNERISVLNRPEQNGPVGGVGTRENARGLDLNRDHIKLDTAEGRAFVALLNRWDPHVVIDLHTTNGSYHGYHLTYSPSLHPNTDARLIALARLRILPAVQRSVRAKHGLRTYYYGNFASESSLARETERIDPLKPGDTIWRTFDHRPRFNNNYVGLRNRLAILSEAYSYLDFRGRVRATEVFVEETLHAVAADAAQLTRLTAQLDAESDSALSLGVDVQLAPLPEPVEILVGDVAKTVNPASGREMLAMTDTAVAVRMRDYGVFVATRRVAVPRGWLVPRAYARSPAFEAALERLRWHGVRVEEVAAPADVTVERFVIASATRASAPFQNRYEARIAGTHEPAALEVEPGALFVPAAQPLVRLAFSLLEAESDDGLVTWNVIETGLAPGATYPVYRVFGGQLATTRREPGAATVAR